jgi:hypothetical protein
MPQKFVSFLEYVRGIESLWVVSDVVCPASAEDKRILQLNATCHIPCLRISGTGMYRKFALVRFVETLDMKRSRGGRRRRCAEVVRMRNRKRRACHKRTTRVDDGMLMTASAARLGVTV